MALWRKRPTPPRSYRFSGPSCWLQDLGGQQPQDLLGVPTVTAGWDPDRGVITNVELVVEGPTVHWPEADRLLGSERADPAG
jgi:hypothetical protein